MFILRQTLESHKGQFTDRYSNDHLWMSNNNIACNHVIEYYNHKPYPCCWKSLDHRGEWPCLTLAGHKHCHTFHLSHDADADVKVQHKSFFASLNCLSTADIESKASYMFTSCVSCSLKDIKTLIQTKAKKASNNSLQIDCFR